MELPTPYSAWHASLPNHSAARGRARGLAARTALRTGCRLWPIVLLMLILVSSAQAAFTLIGLSIDDSATRNIVEGRTLARDLPPVRFPGTVCSTGRRSPPRWRATSTRRWSGTTSRRRRTAPTR